MELMGQRAILIDLSHDIWGEKGRKSNLFKRFLRMVRGNGDQ
jgi:hypothetical protein